jgi:hypothetical protein
MPLPILTISPCGKQLFLASLRYYNCVQAHDSFSKGSTDPIINFLCQFNLFAEVKVINIIEHVDFLRFREFRNPVVELRDAGKVVVGTDQE